jgi:hypothetical protein
VTSLLPASAVTSSSSEPEPSLPLPSWPLVSRPQQSTELFPITTHVCESPLAIGIPVLLITSNGELAHVVPPHVVPAESPPSWNRSSAPQHTAVLSGLVAHT